MPFPTLSDDGQTVTLDLHGATVDEAVRLAQRAVSEARRRGRSSLRLIHGSSTSGGGRRTIKSAVTDLLLDGRLGIPASNAVAGDDVLVLSLGHAGRPDPRPITLLDIQR
ncbi:MAG: Smr/MutS family protein [Rhodothermales bacterium]